MGNNDILLALHNGQAIIDGFRIRYMYYGYRDFLPEKLEVAARSYILRDWFNQWQAEHSPERLGPIDVDLNILTEYTPVENGIDIDVSATGQKGVPIQLEFGVRKHGTLIANNKEYDLSTSELVYLNGGDAVIKVGDDRLTIRGGLVQHRILCPDDRWMPDFYTTRLMVTPLTPFQGKIQLIFG